MKVGENRLAAQIFTLLEHYKQEDPVGIPTAPIQDPMEVPDMNKSMGLATLRMRGVKSYGLSKFRIRNVKIDLKAMKVRNVNVVNIILVYVSDHLLRDKLETKIRSKLISLA